MKLRMCQYSIWSNCNNNCKFCLRREREPYSLSKQHKMIDSIIANIHTIDWNDEFSCGISLLGGEVYSITNKGLQDHFMKLIDVIIDQILSKGDSKYCRYSTVTNGIYNPEFLLRVLDRIEEKVGLDYLDLNFSYDLKYRYKSDDDRDKVLSNIHTVTSRYKYTLGVQMILTQYLINFYNRDNSTIDKILDQIGPNTTLSFLYPHKIATGIKLDDFNFNRLDFIKFISILKDRYFNLYANFYNSTINSSKFKFTGLRDRHFPIDLSQPPVLSDGKEEINESCNHSKLYQCYSDSDKCMLCDLLNLGI